MVRDIQPDDDVEAAADGRSDVVVQRLGDPLDVAASELQAVALVLRASVNVKLPDDVIDGAGVTVAPRVTVEDVASENDTHPEAEALATRLSDELPQSVAAELTDGDTHGVAEREGERDEEPHLDATPVGTPVALPLPLAHSDGVGEELVDSDRVKAVDIVAVTHTLAHALVDALLQREAPPVAVAVVVAHADGVEDNTAEALEDSEPSPAKPPPVALPPLLRDGVCVMLPQGVTERDIDPVPQPEDDSERVKDAQALVEALEHTLAVALLPRDAVCDAVGRALSDDDTLRDCARVLDAVPQYEPVVDGDCVALSEAQSDGEDDCVRDAVGLRDALNSPEGERVADPE